MTRASEAHVKYMINIAYNPESVDILLSQLLMYPHLLGAAGIQPHDADTFSPYLGKKILTHCQNHPRIVAVGEIGLDDYHKDVPLSQQIPCFEFFCDGAISINKPVIIHVRETHKEVLNCLKKRPLLKGVIHCFTGTLEEAKDFLDLGFYISFSGVVTFKNAQNLIPVVKYIPDDRILMETDSPYLAPIPHRGKSNEPSYVAHVLSCLAHHRNISEEILAQKILDNSRTLFRIPNDTSIT